MQGFPTRPRAEWLTILETSYIIFQLPPFHANIRKRLVKAPKFYFYDVGLASYLIGIESAKQVFTHPLRGALFENVVVAEALKHRFNRGLQPNLSFFRDARGLECDLLYQTGQDIGAIEIKAGSTITSDHFRSLNRVADLVPQITAKAVVYGGTTPQSRSDLEVVPLANLGGILARFEVEQEIAEFVKAKRGPTPDAVDVTTLDTVFRRHLRPTLDALEPICKGLADALFRDLIQISYVKSGQHESNSSELLKAVNWQSTKERYIVGQGFKLSDDLPLVLCHEYRFNYYTGGGGNRFDIVASIEWTLGGKRLSRIANANGSPIPELESNINYSDLNTQGAEVGLILQCVTDTIKEQIDVLSSR